MSNICTFRLGGKERKRRKERRMIYAAVPILDIVRGVGTMELLGLSCRPVVAAPGIGLSIMQRVVPAPVKKPCRPEVRLFKLALLPKNNT